jgi:hypothetical protein
MIDPPIMYLPAVTQVSRDVLTDVECIVFVSNRSLLNVRACDVPDDACEIVELLNTRHIGGPWRKSNLSRTSVLSVPAPALSFVAHVFGLPDQFAVIVSSSVAEDFAAADETDTDDEDVGSRLR